MNSEISALIDVGGLLTIDVASELRKLALAQLQGPWQLPSELVRRALRDGATQVEVDLARHRAEVRDNGRGVTETHLEWTGVLLDRRRTNEERHAALTALEATGELALLMLAGLEPRTLQIRSARGGRVVCLAYQQGRTPWMTVDATPESDSTVVMVQHPDLDRRRAAEWLGGAARFAPATVLVDGRAVNVGFLGTFGAQPLREPLRGRVALPFEGETAHAWLLEHGLVTGHVAVPDAPCFEAAVELGDPAKTELSAARLREAMQPQVDALVRQAMGSLLQVARDVAVYPEPSRRRLARLVLQAMRRRLLMSSMVRVPVFRVIDGAGERNVDMMALREAVLGGGSERVLTALFPDQRFDRYALGGGLVLIADQTERALLSELFGLRFAAPELRDGAHGLLAAWRRVVQGLLRGGARVADLVRHPLRRPPLPEERLSPEERHFLHALRGHAVGGHRVVSEVHLCEGQGAPRRTADSPPQLLLPRRDPLVRACVQAVARDPAWVYPAWLAVLDGRALPPRSARQRWVARDAEG
ncbi:MAG: hypothetical protein KDK70_21375 [Myxococcales bacterium]|nr:hypothetical protein [Myxococcales bacterium]